MEHTYLLGELLVKRQQMLYLLPREVQPGPEGNDPKLIQSNFA
jgi:hypothetical protein